MAQEKLIEEQPVRLVSLPLEHYRIQNYKLSLSRFQFIESEQRSKPRMTVTNDRSGLDFVSNAFSFFKLFKIELDSLAKCIADRTLTDKAAIRTYIFGSKDSRTFIGLQRFFQGRRPPKLVKSIFGRLTNIRKSLENVRC